MVTNKERVQVLWDEELESQINWLTRNPDFDDAIEHALDEAEWRAVQRCIENLQAFDKRTNQYRPGFQTALYLLHNMLKESAAPA